MGTSAAGLGDPRRCGGLGSTALRKHRCVSMSKSATLLSGILAAAVRDQRIARNPCEGISLPRLPDHRQRFLTTAELHDLANRAGDYRLMMLVLGLCGLRFGECAA